MLKKKRLREDYYVQNFEPEERPILLIQEKKKYNDKQIGLVYQDKDTNDQFFKISKNTVTVEDIPSEIMSQSGQIRRKTKNVGQGGKDAAYMIEGLEFLPEGFLELDPLLYKDEYSFMNKIHEKLFNKEQRKVKAKRRKQYFMKDKKKKRNVQIFISDEKKEKMYDFMEKWYFKNRRRMNGKELAYFSKMLKTNKKQLSEMQDSYLDRKKMRNERQLKQYLQKKGLLVNDGINMPKSLNKFLSPVTLKYDWVKPRVYQQKRVYSPYKTFYQKQYKRKAKSFKRNPYSSNQFVDRIIDDFKRNKKNRKPGQYPTNLLREILMEDSQDKRQQLMAQALQSNPGEKNLDQLMNEINTIPQEGQKEDEKQDRPVKESDLFGTLKRKKFGVKKPKNFSNLKKKEKKKKKKIKKNSEEKNSKIPKNFEKNEQKTLKVRDSLGNIQTLQKLDPIELGDMIYYQSIVRKQGEEEGDKIFLITKNGQGEIVDTKEIKNANGENFLNKVYPSNKKDQVLVVLKNENGQSLYAQTLQNKVEEEEEEEDNLVIRDGEKTYHILKPIKCRGQKYQQIIKEGLNRKGEPVLIIYTQSKTGVILAKDKLKGNFGESFNTQKDKEVEYNDGVVEFELNTLNDEGEIIASHKIKINQKEENEEEQFPEKNVKIFENQGEKTKIYEVDPVINSDTFVRQEIVQKEGDESPQVVTYNEQGDVVDQQSFEEEHCGENYQTQVLESEAVQGQRRMTLGTINDRGEIVAVVDVELGDQDPKIAQEIQKFQEKSQNRNSILEINETGKTKTSQCFLEPVILVNTYYQQLIEEVVEGDQRSMTLVTLDVNGDELARKKIEISEISPENCVTEGIENEGQKKITLITKSKNGTIISVQDFDYEKQKEDEGEGQQRRSCMMKLRESFNNKIKTFSLQPVKIMDQEFTQTLQEIDRGNGVVSKVAIAKDESGKIMSVDFVENSKQLLGDFTTKVKVEKIGPSKRAYTMIVCGEGKEEIIRQRFSVDLRGREGKMMIGEDQKTIQHSLFDKDQLFKIKEEVGEDGIESIIVEQINSQGNVEQFKTIDPKKRSESYQIQSTNNFTDIKNLNGEIFARFPKKYSQGVEVDNQKIEDLLSNQVIEKKLKDKQIQYKKLPAMQIGLKEYNFVFKEVEVNTGKRELELVVKDEQKKELFRELLDPNFISESYNCKILKKEGRVTQIGFYNDQDQLIIIKEFEDPLQPKRASYQEITDEGGRRRSLVQMQQESSTTKKRHSLFPKMIQNQYYSQKINEEFDNQGKRIGATMVTQDEFGNVISEIDLDPDYEGSNFYIDVEEDNEEGIIIVTKNERGEVVVKQKIDSPDQQEIIKRELKVVNGEDMGEIVIEEGYNPNRQTIKSENIMNYSFRKDTEEGQEGDQSGYQQQNNVNYSLTKDLMDTHLESSKDINSHNEGQRESMNDQSGGQEQGEAMNFNNQGQGQEGDINHQNGRYGQGEVMNQKNQGEGQGFYYQNDSQRQGMNNLNGGQGDGIRSQGQNMNNQNQGEVLNYQNGGEGQSMNNQNQVQTINSQNSGEGDANLTRQKFEQIMKGEITNTPHKLSLNIINQNRDQRFSMPLEVNKNHLISHESIGNDQNQQIDNFYNQLNHQESKRELLDEFYQFCQLVLPQDTDYKESLTLVNLFYFFLQQSKEIDEQFNF